ncbi:hypothetical protein ACHAQJ_006768, partial [Trichoderma viride]
KHQPPYSTNEEKDLASELIRIVNSYSSDITLPQIVEQIKEATKKAIRNASSMSPEDQCDLQRHDETSNAIITNVTTPRHGATDWILTGNTNNNYQSHLSNWPSRETDASRLLDPIAEFEEEANDFIGPSFDFSTDGHGPCGDSEFYVGYTPYAEDGFHTNGTFNIWDTYLVEDALYNEDAFNEGGAFPHEHS